MTGMNQYKVIWTLLEHRLLQPVFIFGLRVSDIRRKKRTLPVIVLGR